MSVSVVIPCFNCSAYLKRAIDSVLSQSHKVDEIIVIDDGSTDSSRQVIKQYADQLIAIHQENMGASLARNRGIEEASSDFIAFLDADDYWYSEKIKNQLEAINNSDLQWCASQFKQVSESSSFEGELPSQALEYLDAHGYLNFYDAAMWGVPHQTSGMLIKKELLIKAGCFDKVMLVAEDLDLWWRLALLEPKMAYLEKPQYEYSVGRETSLVNHSKRVYYALKGMEKMSALVTAGTSIGVEEYEHYASQNAFRLLLAACDNRQDLSDSQSNHFARKYIKTARVRMFLQLFRKLPMFIKRRLGGRIRVMHRNYYSSRYKSGSA